MLASIMAAIARAGRPVCCTDLAAIVDIDERALEGMLETLVARGRLRAFGPAAAGCDACPIRSGCFIMRDGVARTYALPT
jgi:hypothetical protein